VYVDSFIPVCKDGNAALKIFFKNFILAPKKIPCDNLSSPKLLAQLFADTDYRIV